MSNTLYNPFNGFDGPDHRLKLKPTSKMYVRDVCDVQAKRISLRDNDRCEYAGQAGYPRIKDPSSKALSYELHDVFNEFYVHAAMAQAMFFECPQLIEVTEQEDGWDIQIIDQDLFNALDEGEVNAAFLDFMSARLGTQNRRNASSTRSLNTRTGS